MIDCVTYLTCGEFVVHGEDLVKERRWLFEISREDYHSEKMTIRTATCKENEGARIMRASGYYIGVPKESVLGGRSWSKMSFQVMVTIVVVVKYGNQGYCRTDWDTWPWSTMTCQPILDHVSWVGSVMGTYGMLYLTHQTWHLWSSPDVGCMQSWAVPIVTWPSRASTIHLKSNSDCETREEP